jgi:hypothetical protein
VSALPPTFSFTDRPEPFRRRDNRCGGEAAANLTYVGALRFAAALSPEVSVGESSANARIVLGEFSRDLSLRL